MENDSFKITTISTKTNYCNQSVSRFNILLLDNNYYGQAVTTSTLQTNTTRYRTIRPQVGVTAPTNNHHICLAVTAAGLQIVDATTSTNSPLKYADVTASAAHCMYSLGLDATSSRLQSYLYNSIFNLKFYSFYNYFSVFNLTDLEMAVQHYLLYKDNNSATTITYMQSINDNSKPENLLSCLPFYSLDNAELLHSFTLCKYSLNMNNMDQSIYSSIDDINIKLQSNINNKNKLYLLHVNIRSLVKNIDGLHSFITSFKIQPDCIAICETKLNSRSCLNLIQLDNYNFVHENSFSNAGGVGIYIKKNLDFIIRKDIKLLDINTESIWVNINTASNTKITLGVLYKHPKNRL